MKDINMISLFRGFYLHWKGSDSSF